MCNREKLKNLINKINKKLKTYIPKTLNSTFEN